MSLRCNSYLQNGSKQKTVLIISFLLNLILLGVCLGLRLWWRNDRHTAADDGALRGARCYSLDPEVSLSKDSVCVSCDHLGDDVRAKDTLYDVIERSQCGNKLCCYRHGDVGSLIHRVWRAISLECLICNLWWHIFAHKDNFFLICGSCQNESYLSYYMVKLIMLTRVIYIINHKQITVFRVIVYRLRTWHAICQSS